MPPEELEKLKYPVGQYTTPKVIDTAIISQWIREIEDFPGLLEGLTAHLGQEQLRWQYRPGGWSIKQVVHHCGDSHINSIVRFKLAMTEDIPAIQPYHEDLWAELPDDTNDNIVYSLMLLKGLHAKWTILLRSMTESDLQKQYFHPQHQKHFMLKEAIGTYAWHCRHHLAHVQQALDYGGKF